MNICCVPDYWKWEDWKKTQDLLHTTINIQQKKTPNWELLKETKHLASIFLSLDFIYFFEKLWSFLLNEWWWCVDNARNEEKKIKLVHMLKKDKEITKILQLFLLFWIKLTRLLGKRKNNLSNDLYFIIIINLFVAFVLMNFFKKKTLLKIMKY